MNYAAGATTLMAFVTSLLLTACDGGGTDPNATDSSGGLTGSLTIDGSSTVFPITAAVAEDYNKANPGVRVAVAYSGTGGGFKKFIAGESDINNASRPISESELTALREKDYAFIELPVAYDGLTVIVNTNNDWVDFLTTDELRKIWEPGSTVSRWSDVRPEWPSEPIALYGAGTDSGTFDYFTEAIMGESGSSRPDYSATEDDNLTVKGVSGDVNALGYLGISYYQANQSILNSVPIKHGDGEPVRPSLETVTTNRYVPLSRPLFIYVRADAAEKPVVDGFVRFYLQEGRSIVGEVGYVPLPERAYDLALERYERRVLGSVFEGGHDTIGISVEELLSMEQ